MPCLQDVTPLPICRRLLVGHDSHLPQQLQQQQQQQKYDIKEKQSLSERIRDKLSHSQDTLSSVQSVLEEDVQKMNLRRRVQLVGH